MLLEFKNEGGSMGNASSFASSWTTAKQRWNHGPFGKNHLSRLSNLKVTIRRMVKSARAKAAGATRERLAKEGTVLYREAIQAVAVGVDDDDSDETFLGLPEGRHVRMTRQQFDVLTDALQSADPEPRMRELGLTPHDKVYTGNIDPAPQGLLKSDFQREWSDVEAIIDVARRWNWPSVPALEAWVFVVS